MKIPLSGWLILIFIAVSCGFWMYITPIDSGQRVTNIANVVNFFRTPIPYVVMALMLFMAIRPFGSRGR